MELQEDTQIDAACSILRQQHPEIQGLQSSQLLSHVCSQSPDSDSNCPDVKIHQPTIGHSVLGSEFQSHQRP